MKTHIAVAIAAALLIVMVHPAQGFVGDVNGDGFVGALDVDIILLDWPNAPPNDPRADPSGDGAVGQDDLDIVEGEFGQGVPAPLAEVPGIGFDIWRVDNDPWVPFLRLRFLRLRFLRLRPFDCAQGFAQDCAQDGQDFWFHRRRNADGSM